MVFYHNINPVAFTMFGLEIRWYSILFMLGFIITFLMLKYFAKNKYIRLSDKDIDDYIFWLIISIIIGARLFYILFYNLSYYLSSPLDIFAVWQGGLSFHGGLVATIIMTYYFCKKKHISFYKFTDLFVIPVSLSLALGRIGNFLNGELIGRTADISWGIKYQDVSGVRYPSQILESLKNLFIFTILWFLKDKNMKEGIMSWLFIVLYGTLRFFIEFVRQPDPQLGFIVAGLTMGQLLNIAMVVIGGIFLYKINK
ncbi:prolipoprotein diacylglyceryl transferase [Candidatus Woesearchaeota archaeon]|nr:prolipoprotein diacylglyceryl transferase [Candidatus Woesearchaeota archaeon]